VNSFVTERFTDCRDRLAFEGRLEDQILRPGRDNDPIFAHGRASFDLDRPQLHAMELVFQAPAACGARKEAASGCYNFLFHQAGRIS
jgi:hypothetical protein